VRSGRMNRPDLSLRMLMGILPMLLLFALTQLGHAETKPSEAVRSQQASTHLSAKDSPETQPAQGPNNGFAQAAYDPPLSADERAFHTDFLALSRNPHRLSGSQYGRDATDYVEQRLKAIGIKQVYSQEFGVWQSRTETARLEIDGRVVQLFPLRPNITILPNTGDEGVSGPVLYVGQGRAVDYQGRNPVGAIVVVD